MMNSADSLQIAVRVLTHRLNLARENGHGRIGLNTLDEIAQAIETLTAIRETIADGAIAGQNVNRGR